MAPHEEENTTMLRGIFATILLMSFGIIPALAQASGSPTAAQTLFETRQLDLVQKGSEIKYHFEKAVSDERLLGKPYEDDIVLGINKVNEKGERDVVFKVFTGELARDPISWPELTINPLFIWYLDRAVGTFNQLAGGNQQYLKVKFKEALRDKAVIEPVKVDYDGKSLDGYKVTVAPFAEDPNVKKMQGYEKASFSIIVSKDAPGFFVDLQSTFESTAAAAPKLEERISLVGIEEEKK